MNTIRLAGALLPIGAVLLGLYGLGNAWAAVLAYHFGIVAFALILRGRRFPTSDTAASGASALAQKIRGWIVPLVVLWALSGLTFYLLWDWIVQPQNSLSAWLFDRGMSGWTWWLFVPYYGLLHPVLEEWHWSRIGEGLPAGLAIYDLLFAGYHLLVLATLVRWPWLPLIFVVLVASSLFWRWMYHEHGTRFIPLLTHGFADLSIVVAASVLLGEGR